MAFITSSGKVVSFAEFNDVLITDQRLFEANEGDGLSDGPIEDALIRSTERILTQIRSSDWWKSYYLRRSGSDMTSILTGGGISVPQPNATLIIDRKNDFTDLCVYFALSQIILPKIADFGNADTAERQKIGFYDEKYRKLLEELLDAGDWYDFNNDGTISSTEKQPNRQNLTRVR